MHSDNVSRKCNCWDLCSRHSFSLPHIGIILDKLVVMHIMLDIVLKSHENGSAGFIEGAFAMFKAADQGLWLAPGLEADVDAEFCRDPVLKNGCGGRGGSCSSSKYLGRCSAFSTIFLSLPYTAEACARLDTSTRRRFCAVSWTKSASAGLPLHGGSSIKASIAMPKNVVSSPKELPLELRNALIRDIKLCHASA